MIISEEDLMILIALCFSICHNVSINIEIQVAKLIAKLIATSRAKSRAKSRAISNSKRNNNHVVNKITKRTVKNLHNKTTCYVFSEILKLSKNLHCQCFSDNIQVIHHRLKLFSQKQVIHLISFFRLNVINVRKLLSLRILHICIKTSA